MRRIAVLALFLLALSMLPLNAMAENERVFLFVEEPRYWHSASHRVYYGTADDLYADDIDAALFRLIRVLDNGTTDTGDDTKLEYPAYCVDLATTIRMGTAYERVNIEDGSYYSTENARHIRSILKKGYWPPAAAAADYALLDTIESEANAWLKTRYAGVTPVPQITSLTGAEALTSTQAAIWHYSNDDDYDLPDSIYMISRRLSDTEMGRIKDKVTVVPNEGIPSGENEKYVKKHADNINLLYEYLINLPETQPETIIWSFSGEHVVLSRKWVNDGDNPNDSSSSWWDDFIDSIFGGSSGSFWDNFWQEPDWDKVDADNGDFYYQISARFKLKGTPEGLKTLKLQADLRQTADPSSALLQTQTYNVNNAYDNALETITVGADGYYTVTFTHYYKGSDLEQDPHIHLRLIGEQEIEDDVYLYLPGDNPANRDVSQSLVGISGGMNQIDVSSHIAVGMTSLSLTAEKYRDEQHSELSYRFALTDVTNPDAPTVLSTVSNDENGRITFPSITYTKAGVYRYTVNEIIPQDVFGMDNTVYDVEVRVTKDGSKFIGTPYITKNGVPVQVMVFNNCGTADISVRKVWSLSDNSLLPENVDVTLYRDGVAYETVTLTAADSWTYTWKGLPTEFRWTVEETSSFNGMLSTVTREGDTYIIINEGLIIEDSIVTVPKTGDNSSLTLWIALCLASCCAFFILLKRRSSRT